MSQSDQAHDPQRESPPLQGEGWVGMGFSHSLRNNNGITIMKEQTNHNVLQHKLQRRLRNNATDAERLLWRHLRGRQLDGCKFRRQHPFADYILDFVCLERLVAVELDGSQHAEQADADRVRTIFLQKAGFRVLRFWNNQVFEETDGVLEEILRALCERRGYGGHHPPRETHPHPSPPLEGEGVEG